MASPATDWSAIIDTLSGQGAAWYNGISGTTSPVVPPGQLQSVLGVSTNTLVVILLALILLAGFWIYESS